MVTGCLAQVGSAAAGVGQAAAVFWLYHVDIRHLNRSAEKGGGASSSASGEQGLDWGELSICRPVAVLFAGAYLVIAGSHVAFWVLATLVLWSSLGVFRRIARRFLTEHELRNERPEPGTAKALALLWVLLTRGLPVWLLWEMLQLQAQ